MYVSTNQALNLYQTLFDLLNSEKIIEYNVHNLMVYSPIYFEFKDDILEKLHGTIEAETLEAEIRAFKSFYEIATFFEEKNECKVCINNMNLEDAYEYFITYEKERFKNKVLLTIVK